MYEPDLQVYVPIYVLTTFLLLYGLYSNLIKEKLCLSESLVATCIGIIFGPFGVGLLSLSSESMQNYRIFLHFSRLVLAIQIMAAGIALPQAYLRRHWRSLGILLGPVMAGSWLITSALLYLCFWEQFTWV
jgi:NhaP-type Na+/H+ or K+/H+ antiporter